ncbi:MAG: FAD-binding oxidoreductase [Candidatus Rokubacteria bacterium]|nr:FAD-binding oxidoreductase [Candidatus Rokubacteria bacterium]
MRGVVGPDRLLTDPSARGRCAVDGLVPAWVAFPAGVDEVSGLLAVATEERLAVVPRGSGALMDLGNPPRRLDLVIDLSRLAGLVAYEPDDLTVTVQCGMPLAALQERLGPRRQFLPLDPLEGMSRSVGGVIAANGSGPLRFRYGTARDLLLGVRFVQPDGTVTWGGSKVVKSVSGYDIPKLMVGSLGTLGILVEATLRLHPVPDAEATWLVTFSSRERAAAFLERVLDSPFQANRLEIVSLPVLGRGSSGGATVAISFGSVEEAVRSQGESVTAIARREGGRVATGDAGFWSRLGAPLAESDLVLKIATLSSETTALTGELERLAAGLGAAARVVGEAGNGLLHAGVTGNLTAEAWDNRVVAPLRERVTPAGGSVVVERAPRELKERLDVWGPVEAGVRAIMKRLKTEFDPRGVLNPGRFVGRI